MPRYFFHTIDGGRQHDDTGVELVDHDAARKEEVRFAGAVLAHEPDIRWSGRDFRVTATDARDTLLFTVVMLAVDASRMEDGDRAG